MEKKSPFRMGWILVMFDLPVLTDEERRTATRFRKELLETGYLMIQFSIYARPCVSYEQMDTHIARVKAITPEAGNVRLMFITDEQWGKSVTIIGPNYRQGSRAIDPTMPEQVEFWE
jgi:CRISPR-associated protein Cas2